MKKCADTPEAGPENSNVDMDKRGLIMGLIAGSIILKAPTAWGQTSEAVEAVLAQVIGEIPAGSPLARHAATQPAAIVQEMQRALAHFRQADIDDQTPPRTRETLEAQIAQLGATIKLPTDPAVLSYFPTAFESLNRRLNSGQYGLFIDGGERRLYVVQKSGNQLVAVREMRVSIATAGFSNRFGSGGSPYGEMWVSSVELERLHEAILNENTRSINDGELTRPGGPVTISSVRASLSGYDPRNLLAQRGVAIHGSTEPDHASAGCFRADDVDVAILAQQYLIPNHQIDESRHTGTPVYVALGRERQSTPIEGTETQSEVVAQTIAPPAPEPEPTPVREAVQTGGTLPIFDPLNRSN